MNFGNHFQKLFLFSLALASIATFAPSATAADARRAIPPPEIENFTVTPEELSPGAELTFTVEGTPGAAASVRIGDRIIPLEEVSEGVYEGSYTVRRRDRTSARITVRATLRARGQSASDTIRMSWRSGRPEGSAGPPSVVPDPPGVRNLAPPGIIKLSPPSGATVRAGPIAVSAEFEDSGGIGVDPSSVQVLLAGRDMTRSATITSKSFNFRADLPPGPYQVEVNGRDTAGNVYRQAWSFTVAAPAIPANAPGIMNLVPRSGATVRAGPIAVSAEFEDSAGIGVDPRSVQVLLAGRDMTRSATITSKSFNFRADLPPGPYQVEVNGRDTAGNVYRQAWSFTVAP